jgi:predicted type IV restriction endonuclease/predicted transport protein
MKDLKKRVEELQSQLKKHRRSSLKELPTRTIFIDPLLVSLGWDVRDPDEVELEFPTIDGKAVDYALKINKKIVALVEAKALNDPLDDVKSITQVVGYAANDGIEWCVLTNGIKYKVYSSSQRATAPNKLLFEVSIDPESDPDRSVEQIVLHLGRLSRDSMARGVLDELGEGIFTNAKVRKALDRLFVEQDDALVRIVRKTMGDDSITPSQTRSALTRIWRGESPDTATRTSTTVRRVKNTRASTTRERLEYDEAHHTADKPIEVIELYRALDRVCQDIAPGQITRKYLAKYIAWSRDKAIFCTAHLLQSGLRVWLKIDPGEIPASVTYARDVSRVGHWGVGDVELAIDHADSLRDAEKLVRASYDAEMQRRQNNVG